MEEEIEVDKNDTVEDERTTEGKESSRETLRDADGEGSDAAAEGVEKEVDERDSEDDGYYDEGEEEEEDVVEDVSLEADALQAELEKLGIRFPAMRFVLALTINQCELIWIVSK